MSESSVLHSFLDSLIEALADPEKETLKTGDGTLSSWLSALASFTGSIYRKYTIEYEGLLQYVVNQLRSEKSVDLLVLREVITAIGGFEPTSQLTQEQIDGMLGGDLLRQEVGLAFLSLTSLGDELSHAEAEPQGGQPAP